jgi:hypothetical protein
MYPDPRKQSSRASDPDTAPLRVRGTGERQRAAIALGVLAIVALVIVGIMVAVLGSHGSSTPPAPNAKPTGPNVIATGGNSPSGKPSAGKPTHHSQSPQQPSSSPRNGPVSCPTSAPCDLPDDVGNAVQALNAFRAAHGKPAVQGQVTPAARRCAVSAGNDCPNGFFWEPVGRSGHQVIQKIAGNGGAGWLLSGMRHVQVGWAYIPSSKSFECALISG